jgi:vacuolar-type H+-ATPase subunit H
MSSQAVQEILNDEAAAEQAVSGAREQAEKARLALEQEYRDKLEQLPTELEEHRAESMKKVESQIEKLESKTAALLQDGVKDYRNGEEKSNQEAVNTVIARFQQYVGE